jgi:hypothetical protein
MAAVTVSISVVTGTLLIQKFGATWNVVPVMVFTIIVLATLAIAINYLYWRPRYNIREGRRMKVPSRLRWWMPFWAFVIATTVALGFISYFYLNQPLLGVLEAEAFAFVLICVAYYIRVRPNLKVNRGIYILLGITPIGFLLWVAEVFALSRFFAISSIGWPLLLTASVIPFVIGAFIGDWIGKKRSYLLPLSP